MQPFVIIVAGGTGSRMGNNLPKQFLPLHGQPVLAHTLRRWRSYLPHSTIVCVLHPDWVDHWCQALPKFFSHHELSRIFTVAGGATRTLSVYAGLKKCAETMASPLSPIATDCPSVLIHDGVRPFFGSEMVTECLKATANGFGAVCAVPVKSSMRVMTTDGSTQPVDRNQFYHVQTPQAFPLLPLLEFYNTLHSKEFTDDATLWEAGGGKVLLVTGNYDNIKLTTPEDMAVAEILLQGSWGQLKHT